MFSHSSLRSPISRYRLVKMSVSLHVCCYNKLNLNGMGFIRRQLSMLFQWAVGVEYDSLINLYNKLLQYSLNSRLSLEKVPTLGSVQT